MKRFAITAGGLLIGLAMAVGIGACDYFDCDTVDRPLSSGSYTLTGRPDYLLVLDLEGGRAIETYRDGGDDVRVEYSLGEDTPVH
jgi:hypothetical protein